MGEQVFIESRAEMEKLLQEEELGYLGVFLDGRPYVVPLNYHYAKGKIFFHCGLKGQKLDCIKANPQVCFTVARQPERVRQHIGKSPCHVDSDSVICYGRARVIENLEARKDVLNDFNRRFQPGAAEIALERVMKCSMVEITISEMTGMQDREKKRTCLRHIF